MDDAQKRELAEVIERALRPVERQLERLYRVLLEGDDELEIPSLVKRVTTLEDTVEENRRDHAKRIRRLEAAASVLLVILATAITVAGSPGLVDAILRIVRLIGL